MNSSVVLHMLISNVIFIVVTLSICRFGYKVKLDTVGLCKNNWLSLLLKGILFGFVTFCFVFFFLLLSGTVQIVSIDWTQLFTLDMPLYFVFFVSVGFWEELLSRGVFFAVLKKTFKISNNWILIISSSLFFGILHYFNSGLSLLAFANIVIVGILFAVLYLQTKSIWVPIGFHIIWNFVQGNIFGFLVSGFNLKHSIFEITVVGENIITGGIFGPEGGLCVTVTLLLAIVFTIFIKPINKSGAASLF